jgi:hypothetical protein
VDGLGTVTIDANNVFSECGSSNPTDQTFVNIFAHEGIWGNASGQADINNSPSVPIGDIANGTANPLSLYTVAPSSRTTIRNQFGF